MTSTAERAPLAFLTETERDDLRARLAEVEGRALALTAQISSVLADLRGACPVHEPGDPDCTPTHGGPCLGLHADPLAEFRVASGAVGYQLEQARWVTVGDWIQAAHGDEGIWQKVVSTVHADGQTGLVTETGHPNFATRLRWWGHEDKVRVATAPAPDLRWENPR